MSTRKRKNTNDDKTKKPPKKKALLNSGEEKPKKQRTKPVTAKSLGLTKEEFDSIKVPLHKKKLKAIVKELHEQVDANWHDGCEEQGETIEEWYKYLMKPLQAIIDIGVTKFVAFEQCFALLKVIFESYRELCSIPVRGDADWYVESITVDPLTHPRITEECEHSLQWLVAGKLLIMSHANEGNVSDEILLQAVKNLSDMGALDEEEAIIEGMDEKESPFYKLVHEREKEWKKLPDDLRTFKEKHVFDRRFYGPRDKRTRNFSDDDSDDDSDEGFF